MSSRSASIGGDRKAAANSSSVSRSRLWPLIQSLTTASFTRPQRRARASHNLLGPPESRGYPATFNISNSTIANLNLGTVVGDLNSSIQQLNVEGRKELAEEFRKMTEALGSSQELNDDAR